MKKFNTLYVIGRYVCIAVFILFLFSCSHKVDIAKRLSSTPIIFPDYKNVTIPCDIAPIHFRVEKEIGDVVSAKFSSDVGKNIVVDADGKDISISSKDWKNLVKDAKSLSVEIVVNRSGVDCAYKSFHILVSRDAIDPYIAYRLIEPGYENWYKMGIYQRDLTCYEQTPILENSKTGNNCMNCHNFCNRDAKQMMLHLRAGKLGGTYVMQGDGLAKKLSIDVDSIKSLVYPA